MVAVKVITVSDQTAVPVIPQLCKRVSLDEETDKDSDGGKQQNRAEDRIDTADNLVNRKYRSGSK